MTTTLTIPVADETDPHGAYWPQDFSVKPPESFAHQGVRVRCPDGYGVIVSAGQRIDIALYTVNAHGWVPVTKAGENRRPVHVVRTYDAKDVAALRHATRPGKIAVHDRDAPQTWLR